MFRFPKIQALKALPLPSPPLIHNATIPYSGPGTYETILRRFNSQIDPQTFFTHQRNREAKNRGEFLDYHDFGRDSRSYDISIPKHQTLDMIVAEELGIAHLSKVPAMEARKVVSRAHGYIHSKSGNAVFPLPVLCGDESRWVFFFIDSTSPYTYFSAQTGRTLGFVHGRPRGQVLIGGHTSLAYIPSMNSHIRNINLLGTDFCKLHALTKRVDYGTGRAELYFG
ncbi:hypothetical protein B9Z19DRAFT_1194159, partial [Tuber borchii]